MRIPVQEVCLEYIPVSTDREAGTCDSKGKEVNKVYAIKPVTTVDNWGPVLPENSGSHCRIFHCCPNWETRSLQCISTDYSLVISLWLYPRALTMYPFCLHCQQAESDLLEGKKISLHRWMLNRHGQGTDTDCHKTHFGI